MGQQFGSIGINEMLDDLYEGAHFDNSSDSTDNTNDGYFKKLMREAKEILYPNCKKFLKLEYLIKLLYGKIMFSWSQKWLYFELNQGGITGWWKTFKIIFRGKNFQNHFQIHACKNDCALFYKEHQHSNCCPECGEEGMLKILKKIRSGLTRFWDTFH